MTTATKKLKIIPGRGLTGRDIKNRLRNRTLEGQTFGEESYLLDEEMDKFMKMSKTEQIAATKENSLKLARIQKDLDGETNKMKKKQQEAEIERKVQERMNEMGREQQAKSNGQ